VPFIEGKAGYRAGVSTYDVTGAVARRRRPCSHRLVARSRINRDNAGLFKPILAMKEQALAKTSSRHGTPSRYRPGDRLLNFRQQGWSARVALGWAHCFGVGAEHVHQCSAVRDWRQRRGATPCQNAAAKRRAVRHAMNLSLGQSPPGCLRQFRQTMRRRFIFAKSSGL
jgi:hypothetical protein